MNETPLTPIHRAHKAKLVDFAGWLMPIQYTGVLDEYHAVRHGAGLFDVSHMGRIKVAGDQAESFLQWVSTNDVSRLAVGHAQYSMVCQESGGILDDVFIYKTGQAEFLVCVNASNRIKILEWFQGHQQTKFPQVGIRDQSEELAQLAIQGPSSQALLRKVIGSTVERLKPRQCLTIEVNGYSGLLSRTGYTGEIGYEWYLPAGEAQRAWEQLLKAGEGDQVKPAGLGARDLLRLDVGYLLYGNDMDEQTTPLEAGAEWVVAWNKELFQGQPALLKQKEQGLTIRLEGYQMNNRGVQRHDKENLKHVAIVAKDTRRTFSP
ncbi:MAG: glycine cleavage system aminomethyltransferase GcvT, partial [Nitrospirota bacterium]|nr:glycine cleavage system aminomethyltransferase GcvT [Nitrospirota bacterium]MDX2420721.1 glycine cleavage system aminomethyltransferase GcvT [Nitrospirota bacterium]